MLTIKHSIQSTQKWILVLFLFGTVMALLSSCEGSGKYRGKWKATDMDGKKYDIVFDAKTVSISDSTAAAKTYNYSQHSIEKNNSISTYGIQLQDGRELLIRFAFPADENAAVILNPEGYIIYTLNRNKYMRYDEMDKLK